MVERDNLGGSDEGSGVERDEVSRKRDSTAADRSKTTGRRLTTAAQRDEVAQVRDFTAAARDRTVEARDRAAEAPERPAAEARNLQEALDLVMWLRDSDASHRRQAALERNAAAADRAAAATDRAAAAADRREAGLDELTGVCRRGTGELALSHELDRSHRSGRPLVLAIIDVDGLKAVNDSEGHAAGDALLRQVAAAIVSTTRSYDVTVRWGGDEFLGALSDVTLEVASERVAEIQRRLETHLPGASVSAGLTELEPDDTLESLVARADTALYCAKAKGEVLP
ncbi:MAG: hypothetical protein QOI91_2056 [Solirubrobacteraceae bacterium]|jgi:diguanylate cyclase (GGDEF)-like protein|nr:hypothetical protein [Solirubrobacteraceae bacterium]MDX6671693.1 hypothetical protein [Solirubrobacteraceae bacterium]